MSRRWAPSVPPGGTTFVGLNRPAAIAPFRGPFLVGNSIPADAGPPLDSSSSGATAQGLGDLAAAESFLDDICRTPSRSPTRRQQGGHGTPVFSGNQSDQSNHVSPQPERQQKVLPIWKPNVSLPFSSPSGVSESPTVSSSPGIAPIDLSRGPEASEIKGPGVQSPPPGRSSIQSSGNVTAKVDASANNNVQFSSVVAQENAASSSFITHALPENARPVLSGASTSTRNCGQLSMTIRADASGSGISDTVKPVAEAVKILHPPSRPLPSSRTPERNTNLNQPSLPNWNSFIVASAVFVLLSKRSSRRSGLRPARASSEPDLIARVSSLTDTTALEPSSLPEVLVMCPLEPEAQPSEPLDVVEDFPEHEIVENVELVGFENHASNSHHQTPHFPGSFFDEPTKSPSCPSDLAIPEDTDVSDIATGEDLPVISSGMEKTVVAVDLAMSEVVVVPDIVTGEDLPDVSPTHTLVDSGPDWIVQANIVHQDQPPSPLVDADTLVTKVPVLTRLRSSTWKMIWAVYIAGRFLCSIFVVAGVLLYLTFGLMTLFSIGSALLVVFSALAAVLSIPYYGAPLVRRGVSRLSRALLKLRTHSAVGSAGLLPETPPIAVGAPSVEVETERQLQCGGVDVACVDDSAPSIAASIIEREMPSPERAAGPSIISAIEDDDRVTVEVPSTPRLSTGGPKDFNPLVEETAVPAVFGGLDEFDNPSEGMASSTVFLTPTISVIDPPSADVGAPSAHISTACGSPGPEIVPAPSTPSSDSFVSANIKNDHTAIEEEIVAGEGSVVGGCLPLVEKVQSTASFVLTSADASRPRVLINQRKLPTTSASESTSKAFKVAPPSISSRPSRTFPSVNAPSVTRSNIQDDFINNRIRILEWRSTLGSIGPHSGSAISSTFTDPGLRHSKSNALLSKQIVDDAIDAHIRAVEMLAPPACDNLTELNTRAIEQPISSFSVAGLPQFKILKRGEPIPHRITRPGPTPDLLVQPVPAAAIVQNKRSEFLPVVQAEPVPAIHAEPILADESAPQPDLAPTKKARRRRRRRGKGRGKGCAQAMDNDTDSNDDPEAMDGDDTASGNEYHTPNADRFDSQSTEEECLHRETATFFCPTGDVQASYTNNGEHRVTASSSNAAVPPVVVIEELPTDDYSRLCVAQNLAHPPFQANFTSLGVNTCRNHSPDTYSESSDSNLELSSHASNSGSDLDVNRFRRRRYRRRGRNYGRGVRELELGTSDESD